MKEKTLFFSFLLLSCFIIFSCGSGGGDGDDSGRHKPTIESIDVTPGNPSIASDKTQQFTATATYSDNTTEDITSSVTWSSSQTGVATISNAGFVTAISAGSTTIVATLASVSGNTTITVSALYSGTWHTQTYMNTNNCGIDTSYTLNENLVVTQSGDNVTINNGGSYTFTGTTNDKDGFSASGIFPPLRSGCTGEGAYSFKDASDGNASVAVGISATCGSVTCIVIWVGTGVRQSSKGSILTKSDSMFESLMNEFVQQTVGKRLDLSNESSPLDENGLKAKVIEAAETAISEKAKDSPIR